MATWPPHDWVVDELVTDSEMNEFIRDALIDLSSHVHNGNPGQGAADLAPTSLTLNGGALQQAKGADLTSGTTLTLGADGDYFNVTGTTTISTITSRQPGAHVLLRFQDGLVVQHSPGTITLQGGGNFTAPVGAMLYLVSNTLGHWIEVTRWVGGTIPHGFLWVTPSAQDATIDGYPASFPTGPYARWTLAGDTNFQFVLPSDFATLISANLYTPLGSPPYYQTIDVSGSLVGVAAGALVTYPVSSGATVYGLAIEWSA